MTFPGHMIIKGTLPVDRLPSQAIKIVHRIHFLEAFPSIALDSTGTKYKTARNLLESEDVDNLVAAYFEAAITNFTATDATVEVILQNDTDGVDIVSIPFTGDSFRKRVTLSVDDVKALAGKEISVRVDVTTASATSGATAGFKSAKLILIRKFP